MAIHYRGIGNFTIRCKDFEKTVEYYTTGLGFTRELDLHGPDGTVTASYLRAAEGQYIVLLNEPYTGTNDIDFRSFFHMSLEGADFEASNRALMERGVPVYRGQVRNNERATEPLSRYEPGPCGGKSLFTCDPEGNSIELATYTENSKQLKPAEY